MSKNKIVVYLSIVDSKGSEIRSSEELEIIYSTNSPPPPVERLYELLRSVNNCRIAGCVYWFTQRTWQCVSHRIPLYSGSFYQFHLINSPVSIRIPRAIKRTTTIKTPLIVFDIDETLVKERNSDSLGGGTIELCLSSEASPHFYTLLPGILELLQYLIVNKQLSIAFFSHGTEERNQILIPIILERAFPDSYREILRKTPIFSRHHMQPRKVKDLNVVVEYYRRNYGQVLSLQNVILIDDFQEFGVKDQNLLLVPAKECRNNRVFYVAAMMEEVLRSTTVTPLFLRQRHQESINSSFAQCCDKGLEVLQRINSDLRLV
jgi:hypothetical protein